MVELNTREQVLAYLAQMSPSSTFEVFPFEMGWMGLPVLTPEEIAAGKGLGLAKLIIDSETGIVTVHSSLPMGMVANRYAEAKRAGRMIGNQIYPHRWRLRIRRTWEDPETVRYQMTAVSLTDPPETTQENLLTINKRTFIGEPRDQLSTVAISHAGWVSRNNQGTWPEEATTYR